MTAGAPQAIRVILLAVAVAGSTACGDEDSGGPVAALDGGDARQGDGDLDAPPAPDGPAGCSCPPVGTHAARQPLRCLCEERDASACPATTAELAPSEVCAGGGTVIRGEGCGRVSLGPGGAFAGRTYVFDGQTGRLLGVYSYSDVPFGACNAFSYVFGQGLFAPTVPFADPSDICPQITYCVLCGQTGTTYPRCPLD